MAIPYLDLAIQYKKIQKELEPKLLKLLASGQYILGPDVVACEKALAQFVGSQNALTVSNGTIALSMALMVIGVEPGDEVITTSFSFFATAETISTLGAVPVFVDVEPVSYNIDASKIEEKITSKTKAIMPVSLFGQCADMEEINAIAKKHNLYVIEDAAQSFGARYKGKRSCNLSDIGCTSFFPAKPLGCAGDGGAVFTSNPELAKKLECIRNHGQTRRYYHEYLGVNGRLDPIQCLVLLEKLKTYESDVLERQQIAARYNKAFAGLKGVVIPQVKDSHRDSVYAQYTLLVGTGDDGGREVFIKRLEELGVPTSVHYPMGIHAQPVYKNIYRPLPLTENLSRRVVSLPLYPGMPSEHVEQVISAVQTAVKI